MQREWWDGGGEFKCQAEKTGRCSCAVSRLTIHVLMRLEPEKCDGVQDAWKKT